MGLAGCRRNRVSYCVIVAFMEDFSALTEGISQSSACAAKRPPRSSKVLLCAGVFVQLAHFQQRHQKRQGRLSPLVFIRPVRVQPVSTTAGSRIVECNLEIVVSQEPIERAPCLFTPAFLSCCAISLQTRRNGPTGFHWLLVKAGLRGILRIEALRPDGHEMAFYFAALNRKQPIQRSESRRNHLIVSSAHARPNQSLRQSRIGVCENILKPIPVHGMIGAIGTQQSICQRFGGGESSAISWERVEILLQS